MKKEKWNQTWIRKSISSREFCDRDWRNDFLHHHQLFYQLFPFTILSLSHFSSSSLFVSPIRRKNQILVSYPLIPFSNVWFSPPIVAIIPFHPFVIFFFVTATLLLFIFSRRFLHCLSRIRGYSDEFWVLVSSSLYSRSPCLPPFLSSSSLSFISSSRFWSLFLPFSLVY